MNKPQSSTAFFQSYWQKVQQVTRAHVTLGGVPLQSACRSTNSPPLIFRLAQTSAGIDPVKPILVKSARVRSSFPPIEDGIVPTIGLPPRTKVCKFFRLLQFVPSKFPESVLLETSRYNRFGDVNGGRVPVSPKPVTSNTPGVFWIKEVDKVRYKILAIESKFKQFGVTY